MKNRLLFFIVLIGLCFPSSSFATIYGTPSVCPGNYTFLAGDSVGTTGGTWSSSTPSVATVVSVSSATCRVTAVSSGTTTITYTGPSGISTVVFTVHPVVPAIVTPGSTIVCAGGTTTYTNPATGGTWSSSVPATATIGVSTGVITGIVAGSSSVIWYTMPTGCSSSANVTVDGPPTIDSLEGWPTICPGSSAPYHCYTFPGGVFSSSNPSVATIDATTGLVTAVATGTSIISYTGTNSCGSTSDTATVSVTTSISAGTIVGLPTISVGATTWYASTLTGGGGTWSSSNPSVATVSASGYVSGVSSGTATISYTITSGTCTPASATRVVTVAAPDCISGFVTFGGAPAMGYVGYFRIWLIKYNPTTLMLTAVDSLDVYSPGPGSSASYTFCGLGSDSFRVKAGFPTTVAGTGYYPTYHNYSPYWNTATVINHVSGINDVNKNITIGYGSTTTGPGFIAGNVTTGANKGTADGSPVPNMLVYCINNSTNAIMQQAITDAAGHYTFSNLPVGTTYKIYPEDMNYATTPYPPITLTSGSASMTAANFIQHTISFTITPVTVSVPGVAVANTPTINVYPNPTSGALNIQWNAATPGMATAVITDITGRQLLTSNIDMTQTSGNALINLNGITSGLYMLTVKANGINYTTKITVQ